jgi:hypothetical protein
MYFFQSAMFIAIGERLAQTEVEHRKVEGLKSKKAS